MSEATTGNNAKMREALEIISHTELPPNSHTTEVGEVITFADGNKWLGKIRTFVALAKCALSAPPRNCDTMNWRDAWEKWKLEARPATPVTYKECYESSAAFMDWYTSAKGESK